MTNENKGKVIEMAKGATPDIIDVTIEEVRKQFDNDCERFYDPTFEIKHSSYIWRLGEAVVLIQNLVENYENMCFNDVKIAVRYLCMVLAARYDTINIIEARKEFRIARLRKKYPWK